jgi:hypothetical protein
MKIWKKIPLLLTSKVNWKIKIKVKDFSSDHDTFEFQDGLLYHDGFLYIPNNPTWFQVLQAKHDAPIVGHFGFNKLMELISWYYWWPQFWKYMKEFMGSCDVYA